MLVPLHWLTDFVKIPLKLDELSHLLSMAGLEVDGIHETSPVGPGFVLARVEAIHPHPKADRLRLVDVDEGEGGLTVVCGAPNVVVGAMVVLARVGATMPDGSKLKKARIRGVESAGMLCSEVELGRGADHSGIWLLETDAAPGTAFDQAFPPAGPVIEIDLTPNRPDCLSIRGIAREIGALTGAAVIEPEVSLNAEAGAPHATALAQVEVHTPERCSTYLGRVIEGVEIGPSPQWLVQRLASCGIRAINNVVDATNYVMLELGQPMHAFDLDLVDGQRIGVRLAREGERLVTLDGVDRALDGDDLVICDGARPVALAGVMGGEHSGVTDSSTRLLLESACFEPFGVRRVAKRHQMHTDSSHRFERGVDPAGQREAVDRLAQLILQIAGGRVADGYLEAGPGPEKRPAVAVHPQSISRLLGVDVGEAEVRRCVEALGMSVNAGDGGSLLIKAPSFRVDIAHEADVAEEVARVLGYDNLPTTLPWAPVTTVQTPPLWQPTRRIEDYLGMQGLNQAVTFSFISPGWLDQLQLPESDSRRRLIRLVKPLSEEMSVMRPVLVSSLLTVAAHNSNRQNPDVGFFEIGRTFARGSTGDPLEADTLCLLLSGRRYGRTWDRPNDELVDVFDLTGLLEGLTATLAVEPLSIKQVDTEPWLRAGHGAVLHRGGRQVGVVGEVSPLVAKAFGIEAPTFVAELDVATLVGAKVSLERVPPLPKHGKVMRDLAVVVSRDVAADAMLGALYEPPEPLVEEISLFDVYEGKQIAAGARSVGFSITYRAADRTLVEADVNAVHGRLLQRLERQFGAELRG